MRSVYDSIDVDVDSKVTRAVESIDVNIYYCKMSALNAITSYILIGLHSSFNVQTHTHRLAV